MTTDKKKQYIAHRIVRKMCKGGMYTAESRLSRSVEDRLVKLPRSTLVDMAVIFNVLFDADKL